MQAYNNSGKSSFKVLNKVQIAEVSIDVKGISEFEGKTAVYPMEVTFRVSSNDLINMGFAGVDDVDSGDVTFFKKQVDKAGEIFDVKENAKKDGYNFSEGNISLTPKDSKNYLEIGFKYFIADKAGVSVDVVGDYMVIPDGDANGLLLDPVFPAVKPKGGTGSSSGGCDAGLGAFALLGLAGAALLSKKK
jgi:hypothetical protein